MNYLGIQNTDHFEIQIEKSRFICYFSPVTSPELAQNFIDTIKKKHWDATHNCSAYIIGERQQFQKASDDGEPNGTAGVPMLEVLKKRNLTNIVVVVTRYFGGIKLGAGGLVRAYTQSVASALNHQAILIEKIPQLKIQFMLPFDLAFKVENSLRSDERFTVESVEYYSEAVTFFILLAPEHELQFTELLLTLCNQEIDIYQLGLVFYEKIIVSD
ncbi:MAG: YigZ family protein [Culicoidibacterales bacterium]